MRQRSGALQFRTLDAGVIWQTALVGMKCAGHVEGEHEVRRDAPDGMGSSSGLQPRPPAKSPASPPQPRDRKTLRRRSGSVGVIAVGRRHATSPGFDDPGSEIRRREVSPRVSRGTAPVDRKWPPLVATTTSSAHQRLGQSPWRAPSGSPARCADGDSSPRVEHVHPELQRAEHRRPGTARRSRRPRGRVRASPSSRAAARGSARENCHGQRPLNRSV